MAKEKESKKKKPKFNPDYYKFFEEHLSPEEDFEIKLYRTEQRGKRVRKKYLKAFLNEIPTEEEIGRLYGGGSYWAVSPTLEDEEDAEILSKAIYIDESFNEIKAQADKEKEIEQLKREKMLYGAAPSQVAAPNPLEMITSVMSGVVEPVLKIAMGNRAPEDPAGGANKMMESLTSVFIGSMKKINETMVNTQLERIEEMKESVEPNDGKAEITKQVLGVISNLSQGFLNATGAKEKLYKQAIMEDPQFQKIQEDTELLQTIYNEGCEDNTIGENKMNALFTKLGINVEIDEPAAPVPGEGETEPAAEPAGAAQP